MGIKQCATSCVLAVLLCSAQTSHGAVHFYRYKLDPKCEIETFRSELNAPAKKGKYFEVENDASGRTNRVAAFQDGKKISERIFHYVGDSRLAASFDTYSDGQRTGTVKIGYDAQGCVKRYDYFSVHDVLTTYVAFTEKGPALEVHQYTGDGLEKAHAIDSFDKDGLLITRMLLPTRDNPRSMQQEYDPQTGHEVGQKIFTPQSKLQSTTKIKYDDDGTVSARENYDPAGNLYGTEVWSNGLPIRRTYEYGTGGTVEYRYTYNLKRWVDETKVYHDGHYICSLTYERYSNGVPMRSKATSAGGELWAEYPKQEVLGINRDGQSTASTNAVIYRSGLWW